MRGISVLLCALAFAIAGQAQPYPGEKQMPPRERAFYLEWGFPVQDYHFDQPPINENLALAWKMHRGAKTDGVIGGSTLALGLVLTVSGALIKVDSYSGSDPLSGIIGGIASSGERIAKNVMIGTGLASATTGVILLASGGNKARKRDEAMESARRLHLEMISPTLPVFDGD